MANVVASGAMGSSLDSNVSLFGPFSGVNLSVYAQNPAYVFWVAAVCFQEKTERFLVTQKVRLLFTSNESFKFMEINIQTL